MTESSNTTEIDVAPLTVIVSDNLDPRVRRKMEAEQQAEVKTYLEMTRDMQMKEDLNKIKQDVADKDDETDPFKEPESVENQQPAAAPAATPPATDSTPAPAEQPQAAAPATPAPAAEPAAAPAATPATPAAAPAATPATPAAAPEGDNEDLSSAFESHGVKLPKDLLSRVLKDYIAMESSDSGVGSLEHIKTFVYVDLSQNNVKGDTLESVQTLRDPENTILVISEDGSPNADTTLRARKIVETLANRGVKVFYSLEEGIDYLNELYDVVSGRKKRSNK